MRWWFVLVLAGGCTGDFGFSQDDDTIVIPEGNAALELSATELVFSDVAPREAQSQYLVVRSTGEIPLEVRQGVIIGADRADFYTDEASNANLVIEPGEDHEFVIVVDAAEARPLQASFHLDTNASPAPTLDIPLTGQPRE